MLTPAPASRTAVLTVVLLLAVVCAQAISLATEHSHLQRCEHCCVLCHSGPPPFLQPAAAGAVAPLVGLAWLDPVHDLDTPHEPQVAGSCSRAPPSHS